MFRIVKTNLKVIVVAAVTAMVTAGGPAAFAAAYDAVNARNADQVDGKHAVGSGSSVANRKGKLVATNPTTGQLPNNIIAKAIDANRLDGLDSSALIQKDKVRHVSVSAGGDVLMASATNIKVAHVDGSGVYTITMPNHATCVISITLLGSSFGLTRAVHSDDPAAPFEVHTADPSGVPTDRDFDVLAFCTA